MKQKAGSLIEAMVTMLLLSTMLVSLMKFEFKAKNQENLFHSHWKNAYEEDIKDCAHHMLKDEITVVTCKRNNKDIKLFLEQ